VAQQEDDPGMVWTEVKKDVATSLNPEKEWLKLIALCPATKVLYNH
jgi:hypothetical protein